MFRGFPSLAGTQKWALRTYSQREGSHERRAFLNSRAETLTSLNIDLTLTIFMEKILSTKEPSNIGLSALMWNSRAENLDKTYAWTNSYAHTKTSKDSIVHGSKLIF